MPEELVIIVGVVVLGIAGGFVWGRVSGHLPIPELLRMLTTPLWTGALGLVLGFPLALIVFGPNIRNSPHDVGLGTVAISCFAAGATLGLPGIFGWALGYRQPAKCRPPGA